MQLMETAPIITMETAIQMFLLIILLPRSQMTPQVSVGDWVDIQLEQQAQSTDGIVLSKAFVRTEDGVSYVYKDDNGVLKKQIVKVKENVNGGAYVLVSGGLSMDDKIAFPYSKSIKEGMKTKEGSLDTFMGYDSTSYGGLG